jgi:hypothetical protein
MKEEKMVNGESRCKKNLILTVFRGIQNVASGPEIQKHLQVFSAVDVLLTPFFVRVVR